MKKVLLITLVLISGYLFAQNPSSCSNALFLAKDSAYTIPSVGNNWFELLTTDSAMTISLTDLTLNGGFEPIFTEIKTSCTAPNSITDSITHFFWSEEIQFKNLLPNTLYKLRIVDAGDNDTFLIKWGDQPEYLFESCINTPALCEHVCNGGFENFSLNGAIQTGRTPINAFNGWGYPAETTVNTGSSDAWWFNGTQGNQFPTVSNLFPYGKNGSFGCAGIITNQLDLAPNGNWYESFYREYIQAKLVSPLLYGRFYFAEISAKHLDGSRFYSDKIGMYFSDYAIEQDPAIPNPMAVCPPIFVTPQIESNATIYNTWTTINGIITNPSTTSNLDYITIGNFHNNNPSFDGGVTSVVPFNSLAYYLIDDVSVIELPWAGPNVQSCTGDVVSIGEACSLPAGIAISWTDANGNIVSNSVPYTFTASSTGVYTLHVTYKGYTYTDNVKVSIDCCTKPVSDYSFMNSENASLGFPGTTNISNADIVINKTFAFDKSMTFTNCNFYMGPGAIINVTGNVTLTLNNCLLESCDNINMWEGIKVMFVNSNLVMNNTILREAEIGIEVNNGAQLSLEDCKLQNNYRGIMLNAFSGNLPVNIIKTEFLTNATLLHPYNGIVRALAGIDIADVDHVAIGDGVDLLLYNDFVNFTYGIRAIRSSVDVNINHFSTNIYGVFADAEFATSNELQSVNIGTGELGNVFTNNVVGALHKRGAHGLCTYNTFENNGVAHRINNQPNGHQFTIYYNTLQNNTYGFWATECVRPKFYIHNNTFNGAPPSSPNSYAILLENVVQPSKDWIPTPPSGSRNSSVEIWENNIRDYDNGIQLVNIAGPIVEQNPISRIPSYWSTPTHGIRLYNCPDAQILENQVAGTSSSLWAGHGIATDFAVNNLIQGNCVKNLGRGLWVGGQSQGVKVRSNTMEDCNTGFFANWAYIGMQGWPVYNNISQTGILLPSDNEWNGSFSSHLYNQSPLLSSGNSFVLRSSNSVHFRPGHYPTNFVSNKPFGAYYDSINFYGSGHLADPLLYYGNSSCDGGWTLKLDSTENILLHAEVVAQIADTSSLNVWVPDDVAQVWLRDQALYRELVQDTVNYISNNTLLTFVGNTQLTEIDEVENIDELIRLGLENGSLQDLATAKAVSSALAGSEIPLQSSATFNDIYLEVLEVQSMDYQLAVNDLNTLRTLAQQCPYIYGTSVYQARSLLALTDSNLVNYYSPCELGYQNGTAKTDGPPSDADGPQVSNALRQQLNLFPNPTQGKVMVMFTSEVHIQGTLHITDATGRMVFEQAILANQNSYFALPHLANGIYFCTIVVEHEIVAHEKLVVNQ